MTLSATGAAGFVLAADRRWTSLYLDGSKVHSDMGGKVVRLRGGGAATASGDGVLIKHTLKALEELEAPNPDLVRSTIAHCWDSFSSSIRETYPGAEPERTCYTVVIPDQGRWSSHQFMADGTEVHPGADLRITWPPELGQGEAARAFLAMSRTLGRHPFEAWAGIVSALIARVAESAPSMSSTADLVVHQGTPT